MWILFALTSATILASRKIWEKRLVGNIWGSLGWMIRLGSAVVALILWSIFSRDTSSMSDPVIWKVLCYCIIAYPVMTYFYYRAMHELPFSLFGMLAPVAPVTAFLISWLSMGASIHLGWVLGILAISIGLIVLFWKHTTEDISMKSLIYAVIAYMIMGMWWVVDKVALGHTDPYTYALMNQSLASVILFLASYFLFTGPKIPLFRKNIKTIGVIGLTQGIGWIAGMFAITSIENPWYAVALINTHAILTTAYGVFFLSEKLDTRKIIVFIMMILAIVSFAFT